MNKDEYEWYMIDSAMEKGDHKKAMALLDEKIKGGDSTRQFKNLLAVALGGVVCILVLALVGCGGDAVEYQKAMDPTNLWSVQKTTVVERGHHANTGP